jgi:hypothetical protein
MKLKAALLTAALTLSGWQSLARAEPPALPPDPEPWRFTIAPYAWAVGITGNVTVRNQTIDTNASTIDLLQKSDSLIGFMMYLEADKGPVGVYADLVFAQLGFGASQTNYRNPIAGLKISTTANAGLTYRLFVIDVGGVYELARLPGSSEGSSSALDGTLGFRYWNNSVNANFDATATVDFSRVHLDHLDRTFGLAVARSDTIQWVDPVIGLRMRHQFTPQQEVVIRGDVGGFGLGGNQFTWQAVATYGYRWQYTGYDVTALVGFRALAMNYSQGSGPDYFSLNELFYGPIIGVRFRF